MRHVRFKIIGGVIVPGQLVQQCLLEQAAEEA